MPRLEDKTLKISGIYQSQLGAPRRINVELTSEDLEYIEAVLHYMQDDGEPTWDENVQRIAAAVTEAMR
tara:strand:- start:1896 stop:2102 length:207 start_codon:yes stop_codon:yes gene_type:complete